MDLSIIIVSYNTKVILKDCVKSIYDTTKDLNFEVIVVDNASADGTDKELPKLTFPNYKYIQNKENLGFSKANNIGIKQSRGKYILFLNPDTLVHKGTLIDMYEFMENNKMCGASTCKVLLPNGKVDDSCHRGFPTPWNALTHFSGISKIFPQSKLFNGYSMGYLNLGQTHEIDAAAGSFMFVRREAGEDAGWWDEDYFFYGEDLDFCYMLKAKGWSIYYYPHVMLTHLKGVSGGIKKISKEISTADNQTRIRSSKARFNAMRIFYKKHYETKYPRLITSLVYLGISLKQRLS